MLSRTVGLVPFQPHMDGWLDEEVDAYCSTFSEVCTVGIRRKKIRKMACVS